eukprot:gb/GEZN01001276.1/.p1 GENE.gb/GEZN01001276.1/~~gb/GEZN01001276.1/.p1  ORF type:complete len:1025 (-),score=121.66 gb/GEZN01001276.1/:53-3127(-)
MKALGTVPVAFWALAAWAASPFELLELPKYNLQTSTWQERTWFVLVNAAKTSPTEFAALYGLGLGCGPVTPSPPFHWSTQLNQEARFHATELVEFPGCVVGPATCQLNCQRFFQGDCSVWMRLRSFLSRPASNLQLETMTVQTNSPEPLAALGSGLTRHLECYNIFSPEFTSLGVGFGSLGMGGVWSASLAGPGRNELLWPGWAASAIKGAGSHFLFHQSLLAPTNVRFLVSYYWKSRPTGAALALFSSFAGLNVSSLPTAPTRLFLPMTSHLSASSSPISHSVFALDVPFSSLVPLTSSASPCVSYYFLLTAVDGSIFRFPESGGLLTFGVGNCSQHSDPTLMHHAQAASVWYVQCKLEGRGAEAEASLDQYLPQSAQQLDPEDLSDNQALRTSLRLDVLSELLAQWRQADKRALGYTERELSLANKSRLVLVARKKESIGAGDGSFLHSLSLAFGFFEPFALVETKERKSDTALGNAHSMFPLLGTEVLVLLSSKERQEQVRLAMRLPAHLTLTWTVRQLDSEAIRAVMKDVEDAMKAELDEEQIGAAVSIRWWQVVLPVSALSVLCLLCCKGWLNLSCARAQEVKRTPRSPDRKNREKEAEKCSPSQSGSATRRASKSRKNSRLGLGRLEEGQASSKDLDHNGESEQQVRTPLRVLNRTTSLTAKCESPLDETAFLNFDSRSKLTCLGSMEEGRQDMVGREHVQPLGLTNERTWPPLPPPENTPQQRPKPPPETPSDKGPPSFVCTPARAPEEAPQIYTVPPPDTPSVLSTPVLGVPPPPPETPTRTSSMMGGKTKCKLVTPPETTRVNLKPPPPPDTPLQPPPPTEDEPEADLRPPALAAPRMLISVANRLVQTLPEEDSTQSRDRVKGAEDISNKNQISDKEVRKQTGAKPHPKASDLKTQGTADACQETKLRKTELASGGRFHSSISRSDMLQPEPSSSQQAASDLIDHPSASNRAQNFQNVSLVRETLLKKSKVFTLQRDGIDTHRDRNVKRPSRASVKLLPRGRVAAARKHWETSK